MDREKLDDGIWYLGSKLYMTQRSVHLPDFMIQVRYEVRVSDVTGEFSLVPRHV
ncbi:hypothetical protein ES702_02463 [subsurface metagenome]